MRRTLGIAGGALLVLLVGVATALFTVDPKQLVGPVLARVKAATGRDVTVGGDVELRIGVAPSLVAYDVRVGNAPWGKAPQLLSAKQLEAQVALLPLLRRHFELVRLNLVEPVIALETNSDGRGNWELGAAPGGTAAAEAPSTPGALAIGDLTINGGLLTHRDALGGAETRVAIDELKLAARDAQSQVEAEFRAVEFQLANLLRRGLERDRHAAKHLGGLGWRRVVHGHEGSTRPPHLEAPFAQHRERLGRGDFVRQVQVDVQQVGLTLGLADDVVVPDLLRQRACHGSSA